LEKRGLKKRRNREGKGKKRKKEEGGGKNSISNASLYFLPLFESPSAI